MRIVMVALVAVLLLAPARAQVIKGESTDDSAYAPRPAARWHSPESQDVVPDNARRDDEPNGEVLEAHPRD